MNPPALRATALSLALACPIAPAEESFPGIRQLMSEEEFRAAGLGRLDAAELKALNGWLIRYTAGEAGSLRATNEAVREAERAYEVNARLSADFDGWEGDTLFRLDNGQIWRQRLSGRFVYDGEPGPAVRIQKNWLGFHVMIMVDSQKSVGVTRVR
jgi:hypothetical protein